jgi:ligand-binding sensor domain-containing protein/signal transduction histidine kinase
MGQRAVTPFVLFTSTAQRLPQNRNSSMRLSGLATYMTRNGIIATCFVCLLIAGAGHAYGLDPGKRLTQYRHNVWRVQDGFFPGGPDWISQTPDGYLWVGTWNGTFRFDGVRFVPWSPPAPASNDIYVFVPAKSGGFWINDGLGLSHIRGNRIVSHINLSARPVHIVEEEDGSLWATMDRPGSSPLLCHAKGQEVQCFGKADGLAIQSAVSILSDGTGGFWIGGDTSLIHWKAGASEIYEPQALKSNSGQLGILGLVRNSDGSLWVGMPAAGPGLGLERFSNGRFTPFSAPNLDGTKISILSLLLDRDGNLWVGTLNNGLYRIHGNIADHFGSADGLSGNSVHKLYEDQEGIIWATTSNGLDSFREPRITTYSEPEGLGAGGTISVTVSHDGTVWLAQDGSLGSIHNGTVVSIGMKDGLPGNTVTSLLEDRDGHLWVGVDDGLYIYENRHFRPVPSPDRSPMGMVVGITEDVDGNIWAECASKPRKLVRIRDFKVQEEFSDSRVPDGHTLAADPNGGIWLGTSDGKLASLRKGKVDIFPMNLRGNPLVRQLEVQQDGSVVAAAVEDGLVSLRAGAAQRLNKQNGLPCDGVFGFNRDDRKNWWLSTPCGYVELADSEIQKWRADPKAVLQFRLFDALDGARTGLAPFNPAAKSPDGRLWFVGALVAQTIEPSRLTRESSARPVYVESVTADHTKHEAQDSLQLPALTHDLQIDYTSPSFAVPQKVKFRYRLEGNDSNWQNAGTRRQAFYTNLHPGQYRFTVMSSNEDGIWNTQGATLQFSIAPEWFQTVWFRALCVVAFFGLLWGLYWIRLRQVQHQFDVNVETRVSERTRIARDLHDTLLQSFNALLLRLQTVSNVLPTRPDEAKRRIDSAIEQASDAITEGRDAVHELRSGAVATMDLDQAISSFAKELRSGSTAESAPEIHIEVQGKPRLLKPVGRDEVFRIAAETLRNAIRHAHARRIEVEIRYDEHQLGLRIKDDGKGIDPAILGDGRSLGHWGLHGMQERAKLVGGTLEVWSQVDVGTEIVVKIPAANIYTKSPSSPWSVLSRFRRD